MEKLANEVALEEVNRWLDFKKVGDKKREDKKENIEAMVAAFMDGLLTMNDKMEITQNLKFDLAGEIGVDQLVYAPRLNVGKVHQYMKGTRGDDIHAMLLGYMAALTGKPKEVIRSLDTEDYSIGQSIAIFFI